MYKAVHATKQKLLHDCSMQKRTLSCRVLLFAHPVRKCNNQLTWHIYKFYIKNNRALGGHSGSPWPWWKTLGEGKIAWKNRVPIRQPSKKAQLATGTRIQHFAWRNDWQIALNHDSCTMTMAFSCSKFFNLASNRFDVVTHALHVLQALAQALLCKWWPNAAKRWPVADKRWPWLAESCADHKTDWTPTWYIQASNAAHFHTFHAFI